MDRIYIDVKELSQLVGIREKTLYDWARRGKIPSYKICDLRRFKVSEMLELMESGASEMASRKERAEKISEEILTKP